MPAVRLAWRPRFHTYLPKRRHLTAEMTALPFSVEGLNADACIETKRDLAMAEWLQGFMALEDVDDIHACDEVRTDQAWSGVPPLGLS